MNYEEKKIEIYIEQLGPVRNSRIELTPFMVFTGDSGTGKSYTALLVHYIYRVLCYRNGMQDFFKYLGVSFDEHKKQMSDKTEGILFEFSRNEFEEWINKSAVKYVGKMIGNFSLKGNISIKFYGIADKYSFLYKKEDIELNGKNLSFDSIFMNDIPPFRKPHDSEDWKSIPYEILLSEYISNTLNINQNKTFLLPPSRGGLVCLNDTGRGEFTNSSAGMYKEFIDDFGQLKSEPPSEISELSGYNELSQRLINGKINIRDNELFYEQSYGEIPITASAASIKELAPFVIMLQKGLVEQYSITFEEPETNLHPEFQIKTAEIIAKLLQDGCRIRVTTHSDYFLQRINQLIKLGFIKDKTECPVYIDKEKVSAYYFERSGENITSIIDLKIDENGIPFSTFFETVKNISDEENRINNLLDKYAD